MSTLNAFFYKWHFWERVSTMIVPGRLAPSYGPLVLNTILGTVITIIGSNKAKDVFMGKWLRLIKCDFPLPRSLFLWIKLLDSNMIRIINCPEDSSISSIPNSKSQMSVRQCLEIVKIVKVVSLIYLSTIRVWRAIVRWVQIVLPWPLPESSGGSVINVTPVDPALVISVPSLNNR